MFKIIKKSKKSRARVGILKTPHGLIKTPVFMPIATRAAVKSLSPKELKEIGAEIVLSNTYHLMSRPGARVIKRAGGLHRFMNWSGPILTDSGGYQIFSLARRGTISQNVKITPQAAIFRDPVDGKRYILTPEKSIAIQKDLNSDIMTVLDWCVAYPATRREIEKSVKLTTEWAKRSKDFKNRIKSAKNNLLFGIIQGGIFKDLRQKSWQDLKNIGFDGYAIGGLAVGEPVKKMYEILDYLLVQMDENKPRYLMGVGYPEQITEAVQKGVDMFDCVIPTRHARHGEIFKFKVANSKFRTGNFYELIQVNKTKFKNDFQPIDKKCFCYTCQNFSRAYLHHLYKTNELFYHRLATIHNLKFYLDLMTKIRKLIISEKF